MTNQIDYATVRDLLDYEPETGLFRWRKSRHGTTKDAVTGKVSEAHGGLRQRSYVRIRLLYKDYYAHRLAWLWMTGEEPSGDIDHINGDGADNRWSNLREATRSQNLANATLQRNNSSGFKGVYFDRSKRRWVARVQHNGLGIFIGRYATKQEAAAAYALKATEIFGEFAATP